MKQFIFEHLPVEQAPEAHEFHEEYISEYLWPKTQEHFEALAESGGLFRVLDAATGTMVGVCYIDEGTEPDGGSQRWEFGGIFVNSEYRKYGIGSTLGKICISNHLVMNATDDDARLIAHVHEFNEAPRRMLTQQLGFVENGQETPPDEVAPPNMKRNDEGHVVGDLFEFRRSVFDDFADFFEEWAESGQIEGKEGTVSEAKIRVFGFRRENIKLTLKAMRDLASKASD